MTSLIRTALAALPLLLALPAQAQIVVNTLDGGNDGSCDAGATGPADDCSLLEALDAANADPDESSITFSVSGTIPITAQALVTETVNLDGTSAPAGAGTVIVDGSGLSGGAALRFQGSSASGSTLFGLSVGNAPAAGVEVAVGVSGVEIAFNFIGTTPAGADLGNGGDGILLAGPNNSIGAPLGGNTIGFNGGRGVEINGAGASGNVLVNNSIGTDFRGADLGNARDGVRIAGAPNNNVSSNTIGFNGDGVGILFSGATGNVVDQNTIGTSFNGDDIGNTNDGLFILDASGNTVENNTIGFNNDQGIVLVGTGTSGNEVSDNFVGTNASGADLGNANEGILVEEAPNNRVGGNTVGFNT
ncbi:MAG: NosD domain-containing protein, partial [Bacteroidota bacterium]